MKCCVGQIRAQLFQNDFSMFNFQQAFFSTCTSKFEAFLVFVQVLQQYTSLFTNCISFYSIPFHSIQFFDKSTENRTFSSLIFHRLLINFVFSAFFFDSMFTSIKVIFDYKLWEIFFINNELWFFFFVIKFQLFAREFKWTNQITIWFNGSFDTVENNFVYNRKEKSCLKITLIFWSKDYFNHWIYSLGWMNFQII